MSFDFSYAIDLFKQDLCNYPKKLQNQSKDSSAFHNYVRAHLYLFQKLKILSLCCFDFDFEVHK